jgi:trehalose/maltose hydrolase-like predicted phosphorylase
MTGWLLRYEGLDPGREHLRETLCALGNGRFATRAAAPESRAGEGHYPGTYAAGVFNRLVDEVDGHRIENESLVNLPDWQSLSFRVEDDEWLDLATGLVTDYVQELDLRRGVLTRLFRITDAAGRHTRVAQRRLVSMADPFLAALDTTVVAENWSGAITVRSGLDGRVENLGVERYHGLASRHLTDGVAGVRDDGVLTLTAETTASRIRVGLAGRHRVLVDGAVQSVAAQPVTDGAFAGVDLRLAVAPGRSVTVEKVVALYTSRDRAIDEPGAAARDEISRAPWFDEVLARHELAWKQLWDRCDVAVEGPPRVSLILRLHLFHLLQTVSPNSVDLDVGIPARGLHGEAYRGHVFWDELFVLPFLSLRLPEVARAMLLYRWRRLPQARAAARAAGHRGAMFPWQSGSTGREESQTWHLNPRSGHWLKDNSALQRHIGLAVAYNVWRYYEATADLEFLDRYGAEMIVETASFFADLATYDRSDDRYDICGVMGPDEYHDALPGRDVPGLDDNAYTNVMTAWTLARARDCLDLLSPTRQEELLDQLAITRHDVERWEHVSRKLRLCWHSDGILGQFRGYDRLAEFDWAGHAQRYGDIRRLDRILEAEGDSTNGYKLSKQADTLMLFQLLAADEFYAVLDRLGYPHDAQTIPRTTGYYLDRTSHGSTLSKVVHAWVLARTNRRKAWDYWLEALEGDIADGQGGTTGEGIHLGAMAGTVDLLQRAFTGLETRGDALGLDPCLPDQLRSMSFGLRYRGHPEVEVTITHERITVGGSARRAAVLPLRIGDAEYRLDPRGSLEVPLYRDPPDDGRQP